MTCLPEPPGMIVQLPLHNSLTHSGACPSHCLLLSRADRDGLAQVKHSKGRRRKGTLHAPYMELGQPSCRCLQGQEAWYSEGTALRQQPVGAGAKLLQHRSAIAPAPAAASPKQLSKLPSCPGCRANRRPATWPLNSSRHGRGQSTR